MTKEVLLSNQHIQPEHVSLIAEDAGAGPFEGVTEDRHQGGIKTARKFALLGLVTAGLLVAIVGINGDSNMVALQSGVVADTVGLAEDSDIAMKHFSQIASMDIPKMPDAQGSNSYIMDVVLSSVPGKEMAGGLYKLDAGPTLDYTYTYEEFKLIIDGEFHLTDGTGQKVIAKKGDLVYFPVGTRVIFATPRTALGYYIGQRISPDGAVKVDAKVKAAMASNPKMVLLPNIASGENLDMIPLLKNSDGSKSYLMDIAWSKVQGKEMAAGLYHEVKGPILHYTYDYEEFKFIMAGEFHLTDGTGQKVVAKAGDLMYFPKGVQMQFATPDFALGFFCGQRLGGSA